VNKLYIAFAVGLLTTVMASSVAAQGQRLELTPLDNRSVVSMIQNSVPTDAIIKVIKVSPCTFDTFPPILREMKRRGVPEAVLLAMLEAPYGPSMESGSTDDLGQEPIYHYAEYLKQMGLLTPAATARGTQGRRQSRARASRPRPRRG
jgi:hypothetical protein